MTLMAPTSGYGVDVDERSTAGAFSDEEFSAEFEALPGRFCLFYQPDFDLGDERIVACEALLRWSHPDFGILHPHAALQGTKWTDRIRQIEAWALHSACRQGVAWGQAGTPVQIAVNVSRAHLVDAGFLTEVTSALEISGLDPEMLAVDVPVGALAVDPHWVRATIADLTDRGVTVCLDGVGAESQRLHLDGLAAAVHKVRLTGSSRRLPGLHASVTSALAIAHEVGAAAVAKAVETTHQLDAVRAAGFDRGFGHALGRDMAPAAMHRLLSHQVPVPR